MPRFGMRRSGRNTRIRVTGPLILALTTSLLAVPAAQAVSAKPDFDRIWQPPKTPLPKTVSISPLKPKKRGPVAPPYAVPPRSRAAVELPAVSRLAGTAKPAAAPARAGKLPVWLASATKGRKTPLPAVTVVRNDTKTARAAGVHGLLFSVAALGQDARGTVPVRLGIDAAALERATGGQFASRGRLVALPACAATRPNVPSCTVRTPLVTRYDKATGQVTAEVSVPAVTPAPARTAKSALQSPLVRSAAGPSAAPMLLAAETAEEGGGGDYKASALNPSSAWGSGGSSGALTYSYPFLAPSSLGGAAPALALSYDSSSVDGRTSATNAQASWIGDGWDLNPGFIERTYKPCDKAGITHSGDHCWAASTRPCRWAATPASSSGSPPGLPRPTRPPACGG